MEKHRIHGAKLTITSDKGGVCELVLSAQSYFLCRPGIVFN